MEGLSERDKQILEAIIEDYIETAEPVGSRTVTRRHSLSLSPATVRNVMSDLEEMGYLSSPHTSAGRVPTDKAYRLYVDRLLQLRNINAGEEEAIRSHYVKAGRDVGDILRETSRTLSSISRYLGIVLVPRFAAHLFCHMEFVKLGGRRILAVLVSQNGLVQNKLIESEEELDAADLTRMGNYLNSLLQGLTIAEVRTRILAEMHNEKSQFDRIMTKALSLSKMTLESNEDELFIEGQANILEQPEFASTAKLKEIFRAFEEKGQLISLLDRSLDAEGVNIFIGAETLMSRMSGLSIITASYLTGKNTLGVLGVIGPTRMGYAKVIPIVDYTAKLVSQLLRME